MFCPKMNAAAEAAFWDHMALKHYYHKSYATYKEIQDSKAIFSIQFIVKSMNTNLKEKASQWIYSEPIPLLVRHLTRYHMKDS